jgi:hypothetical protein
MRRFLCLALLLCLGAGCADDSVRAVREGVPSPDGLAAELSFCRRVGSKTGKRIETGDTFEIREGDRYAYVYGFLDLAGVPADRDLQLHLVWIRPDGRELFRRFAVVRSETVAEGRRTVVSWRDAEDLHDVTVEDPVLTDAPVLTLSSRLNVRPEKERESGAYLLRAYFDRELLAESGFTLTDEAP